jgi:hypothetical protein
MRKLLLMSFIASCVHTYSINNDLYTMTDEVKLGAMKTLFRLNTNGYFQRITAKRQQFVPAPFCFILFEDGYFLDCGSPSTWGQRKGRWRWGKFRVAKDSIRVQCFTYATSNVGFAGIFSSHHSLYAQEFHGQITSDSTICLSYVKYHEVVDLKVLPIRGENFSPNLEYRFIKHDSLPVPENWLKKQEQFKK